MLSTEQLSPFYIGAVTEFSHYTDFTPQSLESHCSPASQVTSHLSSFNSTVSLIKMGCTQSTQYYFGFINISLSHLDVLSFALGVALTLGLQCLWSYCKNTRRASQHILGKIPSRNWAPRTLPAGPGFYPYPAPTSFPHPTEEPPATAPPAPGTAVMPWKYQCSAAS